MNSSSLALTIGGPAQIASSAFQLGATGLPIVFGKGVNNLASNNVAKQFPSNGRDLNGGDFMRKLTRESVEQNLKQIELIAGVANVLPLSKYLDEDQSTETKSSITSVSGNIRRDNLPVVELEEPSVIKTLESHYDDESSLTSPNQEPSNKKQNPSYPHHLAELNYGAQSLLPKGKGLQSFESSIESMMISKTPDGYYVFNNITLKSCKDVLKPVGVDRCTLTDYIEDCISDEGFIDYVAFFFCAFSPGKLPLALFISVLWLLILFVATGVTATDFLCPALFMIAKTLGLSQNIAGVTLLAFGNTAADIFASINGIRLGKPDLVISVLYGSGTLITTAIVGCVFAIKDFRLDRLIFVRDLIFYMAAVCLLFYIFLVPGRIRLRDSICLLALYAVYVTSVLVSRLFTRDNPLKSLHGPSKDEEGTIEFEGVYMDDDPNASAVVMRRFLFYTEDAPQIIKAPIFRLDKAAMGSDGISNGNATPTENTISTLTTVTNKSARRVTLFEENLFTGANSLSPEAANRRSRSASLISVSKQQLGHLRRASKDIRRQSMDFLHAMSPIDLDIWKQRDWGGRTMELIKAPIRLFILLTTPMADVEGKHEWNKPLSTLHCITGPIFVVYSFGFGSETIGPLSVPCWVFLIAAPVALLIICTSSSETPPFYYNAYSSYLGFVVAITWIYTISSEVINLLRAIGIAFNLSNEIMGLTILAWGNSMVDLIANISIARSGFPKMAIAACYGGPLMGTLVGIGLPSFIALVVDPDHYTVLGRSPLLFIIFTFLMIGLVSTLLIVVLLRFQVRRAVGFYLISLYLILIVVEWLTEFQILKFPFLT